MAMWSLWCEPASRIELRSENGDRITDAELHQEGNDLHISIGTTGTDIILEDYFLGIASGEEVPVGISGDLASLSLSSPLNDGLVDGLTEEADYHLLVRAPGTEGDVDEIDISGDTTSSRRSLVRGRHSQCPRELGDPHNQPAWQ